VEKGGEEERKKTQEQKNWGGASDRERIENGVPHGDYLKESENSLESKRERPGVKRESKLLQTVNYLNEVATISFVLTFRVGQQGFE